MRRLSLCVILAVATAAGAGCGSSGTGGGTTDGTARQSAALRERIMAQQALATRLRREVAALRAQLDRDAARRRAPADGAAPAQAPTALAAGFAALARQLGGRVGVAFSVPGRGRPVTVLGDWTTGPAWSSIKVVLATAATRAAGGTPDSATAALMARAITASDNAAAEQLWAGLGTPSAAGAAMERVLRDAGDQRTRVQTQRVRAGFTPFGQTDWSLADQARFAAVMPCLDGAAPVLRLMGQVQADQRWGIGTLGSSARFKGGWGPDPAGRYLVRQFGLAPASGGEVALAVASEPADGSFATGSRAVTRLAQWVVAHARGGPPPAC